MDIFWTCIYVFVKLPVFVAKGAKAAFVVGNAQYDGKAILVDEFTAEIGEQAGLTCEEIRVVRRRGNSAQQMGKIRTHGVSRECCNV